MGAVKDLCIGLAEAVYPNDFDKQDEMLRDMNDGPSEESLDPLTLEAFRAFWEQHKQMPKNVRLETIYGWVQEANGKNLMYIVENQGEGETTITVCSLELELTDDPSVFTDLFAVICRLKRCGITLAWITTPSTAIYHGMKGLFQGAGITVTPKDMPRERLQPRYRFDESATRRSTLVFSFPFRPRSYFSMRNRIQKIFDRIVRKATETPGIGRTELRQAMGSNVKIRDLDAALQEALDQGILTAEETKGHTGHRLTKYWPANGTQEPVTAAPTSHQESRSGGNTAERIGELELAVAFVREMGGLENAKEVLAKLGTAFQFSGPEDYDAAEQIIGKMKTLVAE